MNRAEALERWRLIAGGALRDGEGHPIDLHAWIEEVARAVIAVEDRASSNQRSNDLARAIGLTGKAGTPREVVQAIKVWSSFDAPEYWAYFDGKRDARDHAEVVRLYRRDFPKQCEGLPDEKVYEEAKGWTRRIATIKFARSVAPEDWEELSDEEVIKRLKRMLDED